MLRKVMLWQICLLMFLAPKAQEWNPSTLSFASIGKMELVDTDGNARKLALPGKALSLFVMMSPECPLCKNYSLVLNRLRDQYEASMQVLGIVPGSTYSPDTLKNFAEDYRIRFALFIDGNQRLARYLKATVTPEVILADSTGNVVYRGAIDDWMTELGKKKPAPQNHYLEDAINQYLSGQVVRVRSTVAKGCLINEF